MYTGTLYIISAPSGAGKTSLVKALIESLPNICTSVSYTTRSSRSGEQEGVHYNFITKKEFLQLLDQAVFLEHAHVFGNYYGTSQKWVLAQLQKGIDVILEIDWQGAQQVRKQLTELQINSISIFILPPSRQILEQRLRDRQQDDDEVIRKRLGKAIEEIEHYVEFDYLVVNDQFETALHDLQAIVFSQRLTHRIQSRKLQHLITDLLS